MSFQNLLLVNHISLSHFTCTLFRFFLTNVGMFISLSSDRKVNFQYIHVRILYRFTRFVNDIVNIIHVCIHTMTQLLYDR